MSSTQKEYDELLKQFEALKLEHEALKAKNAQERIDHAQAEYEIRKMREEFQGYFEMGSIGMCVTSLEKGWVEVNNRLCIMLGYSKQELTQLTWTELTHPDDLRADLELFEQVLSGKRQRYQLDKRFLRKDGTILFTTLSVSCQRNPDGTVHHILASLLDITDRKQTEEALRESEEMHRSILNASPDDITITDLEGRIILASPAALKLLRITRDDEILGHNIKEFAAPDDLERTTINTGKMIRGEFDGSGEYRIHRADGTSFDAEIRGDYIKDATGKPVKMVFIVRDITERKRTEQEIMAKAKQLAEINASKDKLFSVISHDLRSPFQPLLGISALLKENCASLTPAEIEKYAESIHAVAKRVFGLLQNLLEWAGSQSGKLRNEPVQFDLAEKTITIVQSLKENYVSKNIQVTTLIGAGYTVLADNHMLSSVIRNLLTNAIKFTQRGGSITIHAREDEDSFPGFVILSISDTGIGIAKEQLARLFNVEKYAASTGTNREAGSGLGLALCKEFVEKLGGTLWAESTFGEGSTFYFTVKRA